METNRRLGVLELKREGVVVEPQEKPLVPEPWSLCSAHLDGPRGIRYNLPRRRPADDLPEELKQYNFGVAIMTHRGNSNGRLSVCLASLPENYPVVVSSDSVEKEDVEKDAEICRYHGAEFNWSTPWAGRAGNAINTMDCARGKGWDLVLYLNDDVWLAPETCRDILFWYNEYLKEGMVEVGAMMVPGWECYGHYDKLGFKSWQETFDNPQRLDFAPANPHFAKGPGMGHPFGCAMVIVMKCYDEVGGFVKEFWAEDDAFNHQFLVSGRWFGPYHPGKGYYHFGAQSGHTGETVEWVGSMEDALGVTAEESGKMQEVYQNRWWEKYRDVFTRLGSKHVALRNKT
jgi:hypothetical protein